MKNLYAGLLFMHGHIQDPALALSLADEPAQAPAVDAKGPREVVAKKERPARRARFRSHAVSSVCCATALSPFR